MASHWAEGWSIQVLCKDPRTLAAGGGVEMEIAQQLGELGRKETGLEQYAIAKFAEALEVRFHVRQKSVISSSCVQQHAYALWPCVNVSFHGGTLTNTCD